VKMIQETRYPWDGDVRMTVRPDQTGRFTIAVRVPGWARGEAVPSGLYRFADDSLQAVTLKVNRRLEPIKLEKGYAVLTRDWHSGDVIELHLPMPVRRVVATQEVEADRERVAIQRGPIVYCAEWPDNPKGKVLELELPGDGALSAEFKPDILNGITVVKGKGFYPEEGGAANASGRMAEFTAIPYYAWAHRGEGQMIVWMRKGHSRAGGQAV